MLIDYNRVLPWPFRFSHECTVPALGITAQCFDLVQKFGQKQFEEDVENEFQTVGVLLAENGFVAILAKLPVAPVTTTKGDGITGEKSAHNSGYWLIIGSKEEMHVIGE